MNTQRTPQDQAINNSPPIQVYEVYEVDEHYQASIIDWKPWFQTIRDYECVFDFRGRQGHYIIVSSDRSLTRGTALQIAQAIHEGKVRRVHIDLSVCNGKGK